jgi:hypothetical protein
MFRHGFISLTAAVLMLAPHGAALAADTIRGDRLTTATLGLDRETQVYSYIDNAVDKDWWKVSLTKGKAYILRGISDMCGTNIAVHNSAGVRLARAQCLGTYAAALEFVPTYTGVHYVEFAANGKSTSYPYYYYADALNDCAGSKATTCTQPLDLDFSTRLNSRSDSDWRSINLRAGQTYTAAATNGNTFFLSVRKPDGTILAFRSGYSPRIVFRAPTTGKYFVEVKSTRDTYFGSNLVHYMVATGNVATSAASGAKAAAGDNAPRTLDAAKAMGGKELTD